MKKFSLVLLMIFAFGFAQFASAATYQYVTVFGTMATVSANSVSDAYIFANNRDLLSGFILVSSTNNSGVNYSDNVMYGYVNADGFVVSVVADTSSEAFKDAINKSIHSGVILLDHTSDAALVGHRTMVIDNQ
jgi:hypothetical protein